MREALHALPRPDQSCDDAALTSLEPAQEPLLGDYPVSKLEMRAEGDNLIGISVDVY